LRCPSHSILWAGRGFTVKLASDRHVFSLFSDSNGINVSPSRAGWYDSSGLIEFGPQGWQPGLFSFYVETASRGFLHPRLRDVEPVKVIQSNNLFLQVEQKGFLAEEGCYDQTAEQFYTDEFPYILQAVCWRDGRIFIKLTLTNNTASSETINEIHLAGYWDFGTPAQVQVFSGTPAASTVTPTGSESLFENNTTTDSSNLGLDYYCNTSAYKNDVWMLPRDFSEMNRFRWDLNEGRASFAAVGLSKSWDSGIENSLQYHLSMAIGGNDLDINVTSHTEWFNACTQIAADYRLPDPLTNGSNEGEIITGYLVTDNNGDDDTDGFNESIGAYVIQTDNNDVKIKLDPKRGGASDFDFYHPTFKIMGFNDFPIRVYTSNDDIDYTLLDPENDYDHYIDEINNIVYIQLRQVITDELYFRFEPVPKGTITERISNVTDVTIHGDHAFVTCSSNVDNIVGVNRGGMYCYDLSHPCDPCLESWLPTNGHAQGVHILENEQTLAFIADGEQGLKIVDVTDPASPNLLGKFQETGCFYFKVFVLGDYAYIIDRTLGLRIIDISVPGNPSLTGFWNVEGISLHDVWSDGNIVCLAALNDGLKIIDVSNPASPTLAATFDELGTNKPIDCVYGLDVANDVAFLAACSTGIIAVDISTPASPSLEGVYSSSDHIQRFTNVKIRGNYAFASDHFSGVVILDVTDTSNMTLEDMTTSDRGRMRIDLYFEDPGLFAFLPGGSNGLRIIEVTNQEVNRGNSALLSTFDMPVAVSAKDNYSILGLQHSGLVVYELTELQPNYTSNPLSTNGRLTSLALDGDYLFVTSQDISRIPNPFAKPRPIRTFSSELSSESGCGELIMYDVSNLPILQEVGRVITLGEALHVSVDDTRVFVSEGINGVTVYEKDQGGDPPAPVVNLGRGYMAWASVAVDDILHVAGLHGVVAISLGTETVIGQTNGIRPILHLAVDDCFAYLAGGTQGLIIVSFSVSGGIYNVSGGKESLIYDILATVPEAAGAVHVVVRTYPSQPVCRTIAYVSLGSGGILLVDVTNPFLPIVLNKFYMHGSSRAIALHDIQVGEETKELLLGADISCSLSVLQDPKS
jgi:hypothetical protein